MGDDFARVSDLWRIQYEVTGWSQHVAYGCRAALTEFTAASHDEKMYAKSTLLLWKILKDPHLPFPMFLNLFLCKKDWFFECPNGWWKQKCERAGKSAVLYQFNHLVFQQRVVFACLHISVFWMHGKFFSCFIENKPQCITELSQFLDLKMWKQCMHGWLSILLMLHFFLFFLGQKCVFHKLHSFLEFCWYCSFQWTARRK